VLPVKYEHIPWRSVGWSPSIHNVGSDRSPTARATVPQLGMIVHINDLHVATYCHEFEHTLGTCGFREVRKYTLVSAGLSNIIQTFGSDRSPIARAKVPQLGMIVHSIDMYVATHCHEFGHTFGTCGSRQIRKYTLYNYGPVH
jgi:hypothetical protein